MRLCNEETMLPVPLEVNPSCFKACTSECWNAWSSCCCPGVAAVPAPWLVAPLAGAVPVDALDVAAVAPAPVTAAVDCEPIACSNDCTNPLNKAVEAPTGNCPMRLPALLLVAELLVAELLVVGCAPLLWPWP
jgi:hypothetical protein